MHCSTGDASLRDFYIMTLLFTHFYFFAIIEEIASVLLRLLASFVEDLGRLRNIDRRLERMSYFILGGGLLAC